MLLITFFCHIVILRTLRFTVNIVKMLIGHKQDSYEKKKNWMELM